MKWKRQTVQLLLTVVLTAILTLTIQLLLHGIPLLGFPKEEELLSADLYYREQNLTKSVTDPERLSLAWKLPRWLNYTLSAADQEEPTIEIVYHLKDGSTCSVSANRKTVYWKGKAYAIKGDGGEIFHNLTEGLFFLEEIAAQTEQ